MDKHLKSALLLSVFLIAAVLSSVVYAKENVFYFCGAKVDVHNKYYATELLPGKIQITTTEELRLHLIELLNLDAVAVQCHSYGSDTKPVNYEMAEKIRNLEIQKNGINVEVVLLDWAPE